MTNPDHPAFLKADHMYMSELGLTKREYFAAMAMQGIEARQPGGKLSGFDEFAYLAVQMADALIAELNKEAE